MEEKVCEICGKEFTGQSYQKYCSKECSYSAKRKKNNEWYHRRHDGLSICPECGKAFKKHNNKKCCSMECNQKHRKRYFHDRFQKIKNQYSLKEKGTCPVCGKKFIHECGNQKYCSTECRKEAYKSHGTKKKCPVCGREFINHSNQIYCSPDCYKKAHENQPKVKVCPACGKSFISSPHHQKYCSKECAKTAQSGVLYKKVCPVCGKMFNTQSYGRVYCSNECRKHHDYYKDIGAMPIGCKEMGIKSCFNCPFPDCIGG